MRRLFTTQAVLERGVSMGALVWGERTGRWRRVMRSVYAVGPEAPDMLDRARASVLARDGVASGALAAVLHDLDGIELDDRPLRRRLPPDGHVVSVGGVRCTDGFQTVIDLAAVVGDQRWEQALESALCKGLTSISDL